MGITVSHAPAPSSLGSAAYRVGQLQSQREDAVRQQEYDFRTAYQQQEMAARRQMQQVDNAQRAQQWQAEQEIRKQELEQNRAFQRESQEMAQAARAQEMDAANQYKVEAERREREWADSLTDRQKKRGMELSGIMDSLEKRRGSGELNDAGYQQAIRIASVQFSDLPAPIINALVSGRGMPRGSNTVSMKDIPTMQVGGGVNWPIKMDSQGRPDPAGTLKEYGASKNLYFDNLKETRKAVAEAEAAIAKLELEEPEDTPAKALKKSQKVAAARRNLAQMQIDLERANPDPDKLFSASGVVDRTSQSPTVPSKAAISAKTTADEVDDKTFVAPGAMQSPSVQKTGDKMFSSDMGDGERQYLLERMAVLEKSGNAEAARKIAMAVASGQRDQAMMVAQDPEANTGRAPLEDQTREKALGMARGQDAPKPPEEKKKLSAVGSSKQWIKSAYTGRNVPVDSEDGKATIEFWKNNPSVFDGLGDKVVSNAKYVGGAAVDVAKEQAGDAYGWYKTGRWGGTPSRGR